MNSPMPTRTPIAEHVTRPLAPSGMMPACGSRSTSDSSEPLSEQLSTAIADRIHRGSLAPGGRLPTVRALAEDLGLAPNTVAKAYRALEAQGWSRGGGGRGRSWPSGFPPSPRRRMRCSTTRPVPSWPGLTSSGSRTPTRAEPCVEPSDRPIDAAKGPVVAFGLIRVWESFSSRPTTNRRRRSVPGVQIDAPRDRPRGRRAPALGLRLDRLERRRGRVGGRELLPARGGGVPGRWGPRLGPEPDAAGGGTPRPGARARRHRGDRERRRDRVPRRRVPARRRGRARGGRARRDRRRAERGRHERGAGERGGGGSDRGPARLAGSGAVRGDRAGGGRRAREGRPGERGDLRRERGGVRRADRRAGRGVPRRVCRTASARRS